MQNAIASYQVMQFIGRCSLAAGVSVHVWKVGSHLIAAASATVFAARFAFQATSQPLAGIFTCAPSPGSGGNACVPLPAFTNARNRPTDTSYLSSRKLLIVAGKLVFPEEESPARS